MPVRSDIYWVVEPIAGDGRLALAARPRGGDWLEDEVSGWRLAGVDRVVSLLTRPESEELDLEAERSACLAVGIDFTTHPIPDRGLPPSELDFRTLARELLAEIRAGRNVLVHCRQGIGRTSLLAAAILGEAGLDGASALDVVERARGRPVPDTSEQRGWLISALSHALPTAQGAGATDDVAGRR